MNSKRAIYFLVVLFGGLMLIGTGCSSDPNVEGAKLDLRNNNLDQALSNIETALENNPENAEAWLVKGDIHQQQVEGLSGDLEARSQAIEEMVEAYNTALEHGADEGTVTQKLKQGWVREMQAGGNAYEQGAEDQEAYEKAIHHFTNAAEIQPDSVASYVNIGYAYLASGQQDQAIDPFEEAIERGATDAQIFTFLGQLYRRQEENQRAVQILEKGRELHPENEDILNQLLNAYVATDQIQKARDNFEAAVQKNPENEIYRYNYGSLLLQAGDYDAAIEQLEKAVSIDPTYASALYNLGAAYQNKGVNINDEISAMDEELRENQADLSDAEIEERQQQIDELVEERRELFEEAIPHLVKARELMEQNGEDPTEVCRALFQAYAQTNQSEKAKEAANCAGIDVN
jgi:tetratricopeptide (TPR) repeat protein